MQIIKHKKIYHLSILLIRYWLFSRPGTLVSFNYTAVFHFSLSLFTFYSMNGKFSGIKCIAVHRIYALSTLPHQSFVVSVIMKDYAWWPEWYFPLSLLTRSSLTFLFHKKQNKSTPSFKFFSQYLVATASSLCIHSTTTRTWLQTSSH